MTATSTVKGSDEINIFSEEIVEEILNSAAPYTDEEQKATCKRIVEELSLEDQEIAACTSNAYWIAANFHEEPPSEEIRVRMAMREARRHLVGEGGKYEKALFALRRAIALRTEHNTNVFRTCFPEGCRKPKDDTSEREKVRELYRSHILEDIQNQINVVRGQDKEGRALGIKFQRSAPPSTPEGEAYIAYQMYMTERGLACTEYLSRGKQEKVITLFDCENYNSKNSLTLRCMKNFSTMGLQMYPERLHRIIIVEPPFWMKSVYTLVRPFIPKETIEKVVMVYGKQKEEIIKKYIDPEQAMPFMLSDGKLTSDVDSEHFLNFVPFHCKYDDVSKDDASKDDVDKVAST